MSSRCQAERMIVGVKAFVFHPERDEILLLRRKGNQKYTFPGGQYDLEQDASLEAAFDRELFEESKLQRKLNVPFSVLAFHFFSPYDRCTTVARVIGLTQADSEDVELDKDHDRHVWVRPSISKLTGLALENTMSDALPFLVDEDGNQKLAPVSRTGLILPLGTKIAG